MDVPEILGACLLGEVPVEVPTVEAIGVALIFLVLSRRDTRRVLTLLQGIQISVDKTGALFARILNIEADRHSVDGIEYEVTVDVPDICSGQMGFIHLVFAVPHVAVVPAVGAFSPVPNDRERSGLTSAILIPFVCNSVYRNGLIHIVGRSFCDERVEITGNDRATGGFGRQRKTRLAFSGIEPVARVPCARIGIFYARIRNVEMSRLLDVVIRIASHCNANAARETV